MRNRLLLTSAFIGVIPLILLVGLAGLAFYLFAGQFATYIVTSKLDAELKSLQASNLVIARELAATLDEGRKAEVSGNKQSTAWNDRQLCVWLDGKLLFNQSAPGLISTSPSLPGYLPSQFARVVRDDGRLFVRPAITIPTKSGKLTVVSSKPLDQRMLLDLAADLGEVTLYASGLTLRRVDQNAAPAPGVSFSLETPPEAPGQRGSKYELDLGTAPLNPTFMVGDVPAPTRMLDYPVGFKTAIYVTDWADGNTLRPAAVGVNTRLSKLYEHLFFALRYFAPAIEAVLLAAAILFRITEAIAWRIGARLTRSVTGAVSQLYHSTTHINPCAFTYRIPITSKDQLAALAGSFNLMTESIQKLIPEQKDKQRLQNEITIAQEVQAQLFPRHITQLPSLEVHGFCRPARSVSGDSYDFLHLGSERIVLALRDVSGKGISAALLMATIHSAVRAYSM